MIWFFDDAPLSLSVFGAGMVALEAVCKHFGQEARSWRSLRAWRGMKGLPWGLGVL